MPAKKKTARKRAVKKTTVKEVAAQQPRIEKGIGDVIKLLRDNPEFGLAFHKHFEDKVFQLNRSGWSVGTEYADIKHVWGAQFIVSEILDEFNFYDLKQ